jgi:hypothetical protein
VRLTQRILILCHFDPEASGEKSSRETLQRLCSLYGATCEDFYSVEMTNFVVNLTIINFSRRFKTI